MTGSGPNLKGEGVAHPPACSRLVLGVERLAFRESGKGIAKKA